MVSQLPVQTVVGRLPPLALAVGTCRAGHVGVLGGSENRMESPNTEVTKRSVQLVKDGETKNLQKPVLAPKVVDTFTHTRAPPFIGRRRDFYISKIPSNLGNIPNVNMYTNVFYIL
jgi:hypothetical protein